jgi:hypothetical protein
MGCRAGVLGADCHCRQCHQTFSSLTIFGRHQDVGCRARAVSCLAPEALGLATDYRGTWTSPTAAISRQRRPESLAERHRLACPAPSAAREDAK